MSLINSATKRSKSRSNTPTAARNFGSDTICRASELPAGATVWARAAPTVNVASSATMQNQAGRKRLNAERAEETMNEESWAEKLSQAHEIESMPLAARTRPPRRGVARRRPFPPLVGTPRKPADRARSTTTAPARFTRAPTCENPLLSCVSVTALRPSIFRIFTSLHFPHRPPPHLTPRSGATSS